MGCTQSSPAPAPEVVSPPVKHTQTPGNVSSADAAPEFVPEIVGHSRKLDDEYTLGKQIGKCVCDQAENALNLLHVWRMRGNQRVLACVCRGHYGFVFEGWQKSTGRRVAIKKIDRSMCTAFRIQEEVRMQSRSLPQVPRPPSLKPVVRFAQIEILRRVGHHQYIVNMLEAFETPKEVQIVMELMEGGELYGRIAAKGPYPEGKAALVARRLASAVRYLHRHGVVHRDLKPENLLLKSDAEEDVVKVSVMRESVRGGALQHIQHA